MAVSTTDRIDHFWAFISPFAFVKFIDTDLVHQPTEQVEVALGRRHDADADAARCAGGVLACAVRADFSSRAG